MAEERIRRLAFGTSDTAVDAYWHLLWPNDPDEMLVTRTRQRAYLARYGRQDWFAWDDHEVTEMVEAYLAIADLVAKESDLSSVTER